MALSEFLTISESHDLFILKMGWGGAHLLMNSCISLWRSPPQASCPPLQSREPSEVHLHRWSRCGANLEDGPHKENTGMFVRLGE